MLSWGGSVLGRFSGSCTLGMQGQIQGGAGLLISALTWTGPLFPHRSQTLGSVVEGLG